MAKPTFDVDQLISSKDASKKFGEVRRKAQKLPQFVMDNGTVDTVIIGYDLFEQLFERLSKLEIAAEEQLLIERVERLDRDPASAVPWKAVRRDS